MESLVPFPAGPYLGRMSTTPAPPSADNVLAFPDISVGDKKTSRDLWSATIMERGYSIVPTLLMWGQAKLGLKAEELNVLLQLISHRWSTENDPHPAKETIAVRMGRDPRTVQRYLTQLEKKGFLTRKERFKSHKGQDTNGYSLDGLVRKLDAIAPDFKKVAELNKLRRAKAERPTAK